MDKKYTVSQNQYNRLDKLNKILGEKLRQSGAREATEFHKIVISCQCNCESEEIVKAILLTDYSDLNIQYMESCLIGCESVYHKENRLHMLRQNFKGVK